MTQGKALSGRMLEIVRTARGLTQGELGRRSQISQSVISKLESGVLVDAGERMLTLAEVLDVPVERLTSEPLAETLLSACVFHRKRSSLPVSHANRLRAMLQLVRLQVDPLVKAEFGGRRPPTIRPTNDGYVSPEDIARRVRALVGDTDGPLLNVSGLAEALGIALVELDFEAPKLDAIGSAQDDEQPLILLNTATTGDRRRFTLAHEIGHVVMHAEPAAEQETQADRFASELLMPAVSISRELEGLTQGDLPGLKVRWGVSMAALVRRGRDLGSISDWDYKNLNIALSSAGYRTREPIDIPIERPTVIAAAMRRRIAAGEAIEVIASDLLMTPNDFDQTYGALL